MIQNTWGSKLATAIDIFVMSVQASDLFLVSMIVPLLSHFNSIHCHISSLGILF